MNRLRETLKRWTLKSFALSHNPLLYQTTNVQVNLVSSILLEFIDCMFIWFIDNFVVVVHGRCQDRKKKCRTWGKSGFCKRSSGKNYVKYMNKVCCQTCQSINTGKFQTSIKHWENSSQCMIHIWVSSSFILSWFIFILSWFM